MSTVVAPVSGKLVSLTEVPDPLFAAGALGDGVAIRPPDATKQVDVLAPISGTVLRVMPHAFLIVDEGGQGVLVHLGIDTVQLKGRGFVVHSYQGQSVTAGQSMASFCPADVRSWGFDPVCPCVLTDTSFGTITQLVSDKVRAGEDLYEF